MSAPTLSPELPGNSNSTRWQFYGMLLVSIVAVSPFLVWPQLGRRLLATGFLPHAYCYLWSPGLVWTHVVADASIGIAYFAISVTLAYLVQKARHEIPYPWMLAAFGLFIIACGGTHFMEVLTIWIPAYVLSAVVKVFTAIVSLITAVLLPLRVPHIVGLARKARTSEQVTAKLRASEERKEALLREVHHRVKNNLAVICSLFFLQSTHTKDEETVQIFCDMENRVHSMALVHESLYRSENLARINFAEYAQALAKDILSSHESPDVPVNLVSDLEPVVMSIDLAVPCGLILNELISNAFKHGFPRGAGGEIKLTLHTGSEGKCTLCVEDNGVGIPGDLDVNNSKSLGLRLVGLLAHQIRGAFQLVKGNSGTSAYLQFTVDPHAC